MRLSLLTVCTLSLDECPHFISPPCHRPILRRPGAPRKENAFSGHAALAPDGRVLRRYSAWVRLLTFSDAPSLMADTDKAVTPTSKRIRQSDTSPPTIPPIKFKTRVANPCYIFVSYNSGLNSRTLPELLGQVNTRVRWSICQIAQDAGTSSHGEPATSLRDRGR